MAVEKMQLVNVVGQIGSFNKASEKIYEAGTFHPEKTKSFLGKFESIVPFDQKNPYEQNLSRALEVLSACGLAPELVDFSENNLSLDEIYNYMSDILGRAVSTDKKHSEYLSAISRCEYMIESLRPLSDIDTPLENLLNFKFIAVRFGKMPTSSNERYRLFILQNEDVFFFNFHEHKDYVYGMYIAPVTKISEIDTMFGSLGFERTVIPAHIKGTPSEAVEALERDAAELHEKQRELLSDFSEYVESQKEKIFSLYSKTRHDFELYRLKKSATKSSDSFYLIGWVPQARASEFIAMFDDHTDIMCVRVEEHDEEIECNTPPPTKLKNFALFRPFEMLLRMYALPSYNEFDPTPMIAITYPLVFGIMFGDVGQGAVLILVGLLLGFVRKLDFGKIMAVMGVFSMIFGFIYGSVFGYEDILPFGFNVMHSSETISFTLVGAVVLGIALIAIMLITNIINGIRQRNIEKVIFSHNGVAGMLFYVGVVAILMALFSIGPSLFTPIFIIVFLVFPLLLIYLREPLSRLCERRKDWIPENPGLYLLENLFELFDVLLSYVTGTISFIRMGAFALNHVGMMMVVFILAQNVNGSENIAVVVIGNIVVIGLEGLIVFIQALRLHYYELFNRFFSGAGREFVPAKINYNKNTF